LEINLERGSELLTESSLPAGEDLLVASADKPFRFPATFTFVVRSFTVLDGIGKSLDPRFDISEIAAPYARDLILEAKPQFAKLQQEFNKRLDKQVSAMPACSSARCVFCHTYLGAGSRHPFPIPHIHILSWISQQDCSALRHPKSQAAVELE